MGSRAILLRSATRAVRPAPMVPNVHLPLFLVRSLATSPTSSTPENPPAASATATTASTATTPSSSSPPPPQPSSLPPRLHHPNTVSRKLGTVVSAGRMARTIRVRFAHLTYDKHLHKTFPAATTFLVSDPAGAAREGDVVEFINGERRSPRVHHMLERIVVPFGGVGIEERPPVMGAAERAAIRAERRARKGKGEPRVGKIRARVLRRLEGMDEEEKKALGLI